ncbi:MAG: alpha/beta hydrolase-fold protein [Actinomycetota bacterium]
MSTDSLADLLDAIDAATTVGASPDPSGPDIGALIERIRTHPEIEAMESVDVVDGIIAGRVARALAEHGVVPDLPLAAALSHRAHGAGVPDSGRLHARCVDMLNLYQGRPQPYGTVTVEHQGELVQPAVDPATTDDERASLGVVPLAELRAEVQEANRNLARARAADPGAFPPNQRHGRVWTDPTADEVRARIAADGSAWADGDVLTFATEADAPVVVTPVFPIPSWSIGDGLQVLQVRVDRLAEAVITYTFTPTDGAAAMSFRRGSHDGRFRGPAAPEELRSNDPLVGSVIDHQVPSAACGGDRLVSVYLPPSHEAGSVADLPVIYATDGNMFAPYARRLDAAIDDGWCPPVAVVAAHSAPMDAIQGNQRALEYLPGFDDRRFDAHQRFFVDELRQWAIATLGVQDERDHTAVFGCSDGGGHALATGRLHLDRFGHILAFSTGTPPDPAVAWTANHPSVHLCAGTLEDGFFQATSAWAGFLHQVGAPYHFTERVAGHDLIQWAEELPRAITRIWG